MSLVQEVRFLQQCHHHCVGLAMLTLHCKVLPSIQFDVQYIPSGRITQLKLFDSKAAVAFVGQVLQEHDTVFHSDHTFVDRQMLRWNKMSLERTVHCIEYWTHFAPGIKVLLSACRCVQSPNMQKTGQQHKLVVGHDASEEGSRLRWVLGRPVVFHVFLSYQAHVDRQSEVLLH